MGAASILASHQAASFQGGFSRHVGLHGTNMAGQKYKLGH
jgi:hypothetical protein